MKLLVMSDTHKDKSAMEEVIRLYAEKVDGIIHCGDSELEASYFEDKPVSIVKGNCDYDLGFPEEKIISIEDHIILIVHGHLHQVKTTLMPLYYRAQEVGAKIVCFGHSHLLGAEFQNDILFVNPGSLHKPRGRKEKSYAIIEEQSDGWQVLFYSPNHMLLEEVNFKI
ncbi:MAG: metallophosphoesterase [Psychrobacillus sp.]